MALTRAQIQTAFQNSLGRPATANDENSFFSVSQSGALTDAQIFTTISNSQEANLAADPVVRFYQAAFGRVPDQGGLDNATDYVRAFGATAQTYQSLANMFAQSTEFTNRFGTGTAVDAAYVQALYSTILGRTASAGEVDAFVSGANGYTTRGGVLYAISQSGEAQSISDAAVNGFLNNAAQGTAVYTGSLYSAQNGQPGGSLAGQNFNLQVAADSVTGTSNNDTVTGVTDIATPANSTFTAADQLNLGGGTDTLNLTISGASDTAGSLPAATLNSVENINIRDVSTLANGAQQTGGNFNLALVNGEQQVFSDRSTAAVNFSNVGSSSTTGTAATVGLRGDGTTTVGNVTFSTATATDQVSIAIEGGVGPGVTTAPTITNTTATTATTASISSTSGANRVGAVDLTSSANVLTTLNVNATSNLTATLVDNDFVSAGATLNITGGATSVNLGAGGVFKTINAGGLTGGVTMALDTVTTSFTGGQGNDVISTAALASNTGSSINAGAGNADRLVIGATGDVDIAAEAQNYAGFEILEAGTGVTVDASLFTNSGVTGVRATGSAIFNNLTAAQAGNVTITANATNPTFAITNATVPGQADTLALTVDDQNAAVNTVTLDNLTTNGIETVSINAIDKVTVSALNNTAGLQTLTLTGGQDINITTGAANLGANGAINGSTATGKLNINASALATNGVGITGGSANDVLVGSNQVDALNGGAGDDVLSGGVGADVLTFGAGNDEAHFTSVNGNAFIGGDRIIDFTSGAGTNTGDFIAFLDNDAAAGAGAVNFANTTDNVAGAQGVRLAAADYVEARAGITDIVGGDTLKVIELQSAQTTVQLQTALGGAAEGYVVAFNSTTGKGEIYYDDNYSTADGRSLVATLDNVTTLSQVQALTSKDFGVYTTNTTLIGTGAAETLTGTANADTITGLGGADQINGLAGNDTLDGGAGIDSITGGTAADALTGGTELDVYNFAAGDSVVTIAGAANAGTIAGFDTITDFAIGTGGSNSETFNTVGTATVVGNGAVDATDSTLTVGGVALKSYSVTNGIVTFDDADTFATAVTLTGNAGVAAATQLLQANDIGDAGATVAFVVGGNSYVYTQGTADGLTNAADVLVELTGVTATSVATTNANSAGLVFVA